MTNHHFLPDSPVTQEVINTILCITSNLKFTKISQSFLLWFNETSQFSFFNHIQLPLKLIRLCYTVRTCKVACMYCTYMYARLELLSVRLRTISTYIFHCRECHILHSCNTCTCLFLSYSLRLANLYEVPLSL